MFLSMSISTMDLDVERLCAPVSQVVSEASPFGRGWVGTAAPFHSDRVVIMTAVIAWRYMKFNRSSF